MLREGLSSNENVAKEGLSAICYLACYNDENRRLLGDAGVCGGELTGFYFVLF